MALNITVNGEQRQTQAPTLSALVEELGLGPRPVAALLNGEVAPRSQWESTVLAPGDEVEILSLVGGG